MGSVTESSAIPVNKPPRKSYWCGSRSWLVSRYSESWLWTTFSATFVTTGSTSEIGLWFKGSFRSLDLCVGITKASFLLVGIWPLVIELLITGVSVAQAIVGSPALSRRDVMSSLPWSALLAILRTALLTPENAYTRLRWTDEVRTPLDSWRLFCLYKDFNFRGRLKTFLFSKAFLPL